MPMRFVLEAVIEGLAEVGLRAAGYWTGWLLVPLLSFGRYRVATVEPLPNRAQRRARREQARRSRKHRSGPALAEPALAEPGVAEPSVISADAASVLGLLFWIGLLVLGVWLALRS